MEKTINEAIEIFETGLVKKIKRGEISVLEYENEIHSLRKNARVDKVEYLKGQLINAQRFLENAKNELEQLQKAKSFISELKEIDKNIYELNQQKYSIYNKIGDKASIIMLELAGIEREGFCSAI